MPLALRERIPDLKKIRFIAILIKDLSVSQQWSEAFPDLVGITVVTGGRRWFSGDNAARFDEDVRYFVSNGLPLAHIVWPGDWGLYHVGMNLKTSTQWREKGRVSPKIRVCDVVKDSARMDGRLENDDGWEESIMREA